MDSSSPNGVDALTERLRDPDTRRVLARLLDRVDALERALDLLEQMPAVVETTADALDDDLTRAADRGVVLDERAREGLALLERLTDPDTADTLHHLLDRTDDLDALAHLAEALADTQRAADRGETPQTGLFGLIGALRDPDVQRTLGFVTTLAKTFGQRLRT